MGLTQQEFYNSHKILGIFKELTNYKIFKTEVYDGYIKEKITVHYLKLEQNNIPISKEQFENLKKFGIKEIII